MRAPYTLHPSSAPVARQPLVRGLSSFKGWKTRLGGYRVKLFSLGLVALVAASPVSLHRSEQRENKELRSAQLCFVHGRALFLNGSADSHGAT